MLTRKKIKPSKTTMSYVKEFSDLVNSKISEEALDQLASIMKKHGDEKQKEIKNWKYRESS